MEPKQIDKLLPVLDRLSCFSISCTECPYNTSDDCEGELKQDLAEALKRLKFLETPSKKEQPELPIYIPMPIEELHGKDWEKEKSQSSGWLRERCPELWDLFTEFRLKNKISFCLCSRTFLRITNTYYLYSDGVTMRGGGVKTFDDFMNLSREKVLNIRNIGKKGARLIELVQEYARTSRSL